MTSIRFSSHLQLYPLLVPQGTIPEDSSNFDSVIPKTILISASQFLPDKGYVSTTSLLKLVNKFIR